MTIECSTSGAVALVQERRFQLVDESGRARLFMLTRDAPDGTQLAPLAGSGQRVTVRYRETPGLIGGCGVS